MLNIYYQSSFIIIVTYLSINPLHCYYVIIDEKLNGFLQTFTNLKILPQNNKTKKLERFHLDIETKEDFKTLSIYLSITNCVKAKKREFWPQNA